MSMIVKTAAFAAALILTGTVAGAQERDIAKEDANRQIVIDFYERFFTAHDLTAAEVIADEYTQHNPQVPDGKQPFIDFFTGWFAENPQSKSRIVQTAADGDLVWLHVHSTNGPDDPGLALVDIFRVKDGKLVEHWDVIQSVPATAANTNTMF